MRLRVGEKENQEEKREAEESEGEGGSVGEGKPSKMKSVMKSVTRNGVKAKNVKRKSVQNV